MKQEIISAQFSLMFLSSINRPDIHFSNIEANSEGIFNGIPTSQDIPPGLPIEIPIKTLKSEDNKYICNIGRTRIDFICQRVNENENNSEILDRLNNIVNLNLRNILQLTKIIRFGLVANHCIFCEDPISIIRTKFLPNLPESAVEAGINFNERTKFKNYEINDVLNISIGSVQIENSAPQKAIIIIRDINNVPYPNKEDIDYSSLKEISKKFSSYISEETIAGLIK